MDNTTNVTNKTTETAAAKEGRKSGLFSARYISGAAMLSAVAAILQYMEVVIGIMPGFIKFDLSDLPALIGAFAYGPLAGVLIELIKNLLHCAVSQSATVGELSNFLLGAVFTGTAGCIYALKKNKKSALIASIVGAVAMGLLSVPINYYVVYPVYYNFMSEDAVLGAYQAINGNMKNMFQCLLVFNLPFTIVKGLISGAITMMIYKPLSYVLKGRDH